MHRLLAESYRLRLIRGLEDSLLQLGFERVAGVDEVGRGSLAGPVVAAAVVPAPNSIVPGVDDSKRLSAPQRREIARLIRSHSLAWSVGTVPAKRIDRTNVLYATRESMLEALQGLAPQPDCVLVDAVTLTDLPYPCLSVVRGDRLSYAVAAASILAKVERDRMMCELGDRYPHYGFSRHKGYGAREHLEALSEFGPCPSHRLTFKSVLPRCGEREPAAASAAI